MTADEIMFVFIFSAVGVAAWMGVIVMAYAIWKEISK